jgi:hypothetical protein
LGDYVFVVKEGVKVEVEWTRESRLRIRHNATADQVYQSHSQVAGVTVEYATLDGTPAPLPLPPQTENKK